MRKEDLKFGNVVETRNGNKYLFNIYSGPTLYNLDGKGYMDWAGYCDDLSRRRKSCIRVDDISVDYDIMKVYEDHTCKKLLWERCKELTEDEKAILRNLPVGYEWIARDESGHLNIFIFKPKKEDEDEDAWFKGCWYDSSGDDNCLFLEVFDHLFLFIKWEDEEPYLIEDLLGGE